MRPSAPLRVASLAAAAAAVFLALRSVPPEGYLEEPAAAAEKATRKFIERVKRDNKILAFWTFDAVRPGVRSPSLEGLDPAGAGSVSAKGRFGEGRKLDGRRGRGIPVAKFHMPFADVSVTAWVRPGRLPGRQDVFVSYSGAIAGFRLDGDDLCYDQPAAGKGFVTLRTPFARSGGFSHIAAVARRAEGRAELYVDGVLKDSARFAPGEGSYRWRGGVGMGDPKNVRDPFRGVIDETIVWDKALSPEEVLRLAGRGSGVLAWGAAPWRLVRWKARLLVARAMEAVGGLVYSPPGRGTAADAVTRRLPGLRVYMRRGLRLKQARAYRRSLASRLRTDAAAKPREAVVAFGGKAEPAEICLHGGVERFDAAGSRPSYEIGFADGRRFLLIPPENTEWKCYWPGQDPLSGRAGSPDCAIVRLSMDQRLLGIYALVDYSRMGVAGKGLVAGGARIPAAAADPTDVFMRDPRSPVPPAMRGKRLAAPPPRHLAPTWIDTPCDPAMLGENLSPERITTNLVLSAAAAGGGRVSWSSSDPGVIDPATGAVRRPAGAAPAVVVLTRRTSGAGGALISEEAFAVRVMPARIGVGALFVYHPFRLDKAYRQDAFVAFCRPGEDVPSVRSFATQGRGGGVRYRGNTSYSRSKRRLLNLKLDSPHHIFGGSDDRGVALVNARQDESFVLNTLSRELYRSFPPGDGSPPRIAPGLVHAEVYVNGRFYGLFEASERLNCALAGSPASAIYRHATARPRIPAMCARHKTPPDLDTDAPYRRFAGWLRGEPDAQWARDVRRHVDVLNFIDTRFMLTLFQNCNGAPYGSPANDALAYDASREVFFNIPWDADTSACSTSGFFHVAYKFDLALERGLPGFDGLRRERWRTLRGAAIREDSLRDRIRRLEAALKPYAEYDDLHDGQLQAK